MGSTTPVDHSSSHIAGDVYDTMNMNTKYNTYIIKQRQGMVEIAKINLLSPPIIGAIITFVPSLVAIRSDGPLFQQGQDPLLGHQVYCIRARRRSPSALP